MVSRFFYPKGLILVTVSEPKINAENKTYIRYWDFLSDTLIDQTILKGSFTSGVYFSANGKKIILPYRTKETWDKPNFKKFHDAIMCLVPLKVRYALNDKLLYSVYGLLSFIKHYNDIEQSVPKEIITLLIWWCYKKIR